MISHLSEDEMTLCVVTKTDFEGMLWLTADFVEDRGLDSFRFADHPS
jgi:hypothetical protein